MVAANTSEGLGLTIIGNQLVEEMLLSRLLLLW